MINSRGWFCKFTVKACNYFKCVAKGKSREKTQATKQGQNVGKNKLANDSKRQTARKSSVILVGVSMYWISCTRLVQLKESGTVQAAWTRTLLSGIGYNTRGYETKDSYVNWAETRCRALLYTR